MTRGRKKDLTIPPTRSLVQQRDYRARKAQYIASLEERCKLAEDENVALRKEIEELRATLTNPAVLLPETAAASTELLHHLALARESLAKFHELAFPARNQPSDNHTVPPAPFLVPSPPSSHHSDSVTPTSFPEAKGKSRADMHVPRRKELYVDDSPPFSPVSQPATTPSNSSHQPSGPSFSNSECCGGILDCDELVCDEEDEGGSSMTRTSDVRSTTNQNVRIIRREDV